MTPLRSVKTDRSGRPPSDAPASDRLWDGVVVWLGGTLAVCAVAVAVSNTLGWPRRPPGLLTGGQVAVLAAQAVACSGFVVRSGRRLVRRAPGALAVAFAAGVPAGLALLMGLEWLQPEDPGTGWLELLGRSVGLAAVEAVPVGYLLWRLGPWPWWHRLGSAEAAPTPDSTMAPREDHLLDQE